MELSEEGQRSGHLGAMSELVRAATPPMTPLRRMSGLQAVTSRLETARRGRAGVLALALLGLGSVAAGGLLLARFVKNGGAPAAAAAIAYRVEGGEIGAGGYIHAFAGAGASLHFAEATELRLLPGARGRLISVDAHGARFAIEQGEAEVSVTPRPDGRWFVDAGPFLISVHGTVFRAAWDGAAERLDIHMKNGLVSVTGPVAEGVIAVRAGQHLTINVQSKEILLRPVGTGAPPVEAPLPAAAPVAPLRPPARAVAMRATAGGAGRGRVVSGGARNWSAALAAGELDRILSEAEQQGLRTCLEEAPSEDLAALADAARYRRRSDVARRALLAQRDRFPRSARARQAAFLLGRLDDEQSGGGERALEWYERYLAEAPSGSYASEALGRKMTATEKLRGVAAARKIAAEYLRRFPDGTYAGAARALRDAP